MSDTDFVYQAVARAKQVAAKLAAGGGGDMTAHNNGNVLVDSTSLSTVGLKRPASDVASAPAEKRSMMVNDKLSAAAEAAAKITEKLGAGMPTTNQTMTVSHRIPDRFVGLVIGKKGEQIIQLQSESQCKVQIAQEGGQGERELTMIGTPAQIDRAKSMIGDIIERAGGNVGSFGNGVGNAHSIDVMIPGQKAGLVIGKNGETIKHLQEVTGAKMVLIQDSSSPSSDDKPLRITGDASCVEKAKDMVIQLLSNKDTKSYPKMPYVQPPENADLCVYAVPTEKAGLVIGKGGETIREICVRSGAFVEISKQQTADPAIKLFNVRGQRHEIDNAIRFISERAGIPVGAPHAYYPNGQSASASQAVAAAAYGGQAWGSYAAPSPATAAATASAGAAGQQAWSQNNAAASAMPSPTVNPHTGQLDYSAAWAEYYRRQGLHDYADMILRQAQQGGTAGGAAVASGGGAVGAGSSSAAVAAGSGVAYSAGQVAQNAAVPGSSSAAQPGYDYNQWQQWQQWQHQQVGSGGHVVGGATTQQAVPQQHQAWAGAGGGHQHHQQQPMTAPAPPHHLGMMGAAMPHHQQQQQGPVSGGPGAVPPPTHASWTAQSVYGGAGGSGQPR